ncbi:MAG: hypothetical protein JST66_04360 [Bacteroidetes bacterium]|nr:hypothetical protein [Bacteroidota bacterium]
MTPTQSLKVIEEMIAQAKRSFHRQSYYFMLWGVLLIAAMLFNYVMALRGSTIGGYAWPVMGVVGGVLSFLHGAREGRSKPVTTPMDRVIMWLWMAFVVTLLLTILSSASSGQAMPLASIIVLTGLPTFVTGQLMRFRPLVFGGILFWVLGAVAYFVPISVTVWLFIAAIFFGYLVPGYLLKRQEDGVRPA